MNEKQHKEKKIKNQEWSLGFDDFIKFWNKYPGIKKHVFTEFENFKKKTKDWKDVLFKLEEAIDYQLKIQKLYSQNNRFFANWKHLTNWLNHRGWEYEYNLDGIIEEESNEIIIDCEINLIGFIQNWCSIFDEDLPVSLMKILANSNSSRITEELKQQIIDNYSLKGKFIIEYIESLNNLNNIQLFHKEMQHYIYENCPLIDEFYHLELEHIAPIYKYKDGIWRTVLKRIEENISTGKRKERAIGLQLQTWLINHYEKGFYV